MLQYFQKNIKLSIGGIMKRIAVLGMSSIFLFAGSSKAGFLIDFEASVGAIQQKPSGYVSYKPISDTDKIDVKNDAHVGDKTKPWAKFKFEHPIPIIPNIKLAYMPMKFDGSGVLTRDIRWGNYTYKANADYNLSVKLDRVDTTLYYNLPFINTATAGKLDVELGLNVRTIMFDGKLNGTDKTTGQKVSESKSITLPVPMGHLAAEIKPINQVSLLGEFNYISYNKDTYYDYIAGLRLNSHGLISTPLKPFIEVGYRYEKLKLDEKDVKSDLKIKGGYALVGVRF
jgi:outer membrane protein